MASDMAAPDTGASRRRREDKGQLNPNRTKILGVKADGIAN